MNKSTKWRLILAVLFVVGVLALVLRIFVWPSPPPKARALNPVIEELVEYRREHGVYPPRSELRFLSSIVLVRKKYSVYFGTLVSNTEVEWSPREVSGNDLTILVHDESFAMFAPTGKMKIVSFSSFPVWRAGSEDHKWRKGRIHWSLLGTYWSKD